MVSLEVLEGTAFVLLPAPVFPAHSTEHTVGTQCIFVERRKEERKGRRKEVEEMKER